MPNLYRYQERVFEALLGGRNVILQAPTGAGKTRAALYPFLHNLDRHGLDEKEAISSEAPLPLTCRYAVPMRVLASQFEHEYRRYVTNLDERRGTRLRDRYTENLGVAVPAIQTGETPNDPRLESPLTFCTIDQLLASFIGSPYSVGSRQANLNVGAVAGSYLVLDEFHLYPLEKGNGARTTTLAMLRLLKGLCRFVLMTATFSSQLLDELGQLLDAEVIRVTDDAELAEIMGNRSRTVQVSPHALSADGILRAHSAAYARGAGASLVVCNTVSQAQTIYAQVRDTLASQNEPVQTRLLLLHSRFTSSDRQAKREKVETWLGPSAWREGQYQCQSTIVVATQVVEVGLNISVGMLHTELAPATSVIQRAGRCARFAGQRGEIIVYHPLAPRNEGADTIRAGFPLAEFGAFDDESPQTSRGANSYYLPYNRETCESTWRELVRQHEASAALNAGVVPPFGFAEEQRLVDVVHTDADMTMIEQFKRADTQTNDQIKQSLTTHAAGVGAELIRDVGNVSVIIHDEPQSIVVRPYDWDAFSLRPSTLLKHWDTLCERKEALGADWVMMTMESEAADGDTQRAETDNSRELRYAWRPVNHEAHGAEIKTALRLALPSALATYDDELGFRLLVGVAGDPSGPPRWVSQPSATALVSRATFGGKQSSYVEHISGLMRAYNYSVRRELVWIAKSLEERLDLAAGSVDEAVRLAIACHDIGKLSRNWQAWAHSWQAKLVERYGNGYAVQPGRDFLAKTDRAPDWREERALQRDLSLKRPNHSCVSVVAAGQLIGNRLLATSDLPERAFGLARATWSGIARHHAPTATAYDAASWDPAARDIIQQALEVCDLQVSPEELALLALTGAPSGELPVDYLIEPNFDLDVSGETPTVTTWLGFVLVRALRLCDQRAERDLA